MRQSVPNTDRLVATLAGRVDTLETRLSALEELRTDVAALGRGVADVTAQLRALTAATNGTIIRSAGQRDREPSSTAAAAQETTTAEDGDGQADWLAVTDPVTAIGWLTAATAFVTDVLAPIGSAPGAPCWPIHPTTVVELLALLAEYRASYGGENPTPVCELLARWLPGTVARIDRDLSGCVADRGHRANGHLYDGSGLDPVLAARWWAETHGRDPDAVEAFALTRLF